MKREAARGGVPLVLSMDTTRNTAHGTLMPLQAEVLAVEAVVDMVVEGINKEDLLFNNYIISVLLYFLVYYCISDNYVV